MSDEPKKRSRKWIVWAVIALLVLYPLSSGPALWAVAKFKADWILETYGVVYAPLNWVHGLSEMLDNAYLDYLNWWVMLAQAD